MAVKKISAVTLRVANMRAAVMFYTGLVGLDVVYGGEDAYFSSLGTKDGTLAGMSEKERAAFNSKGIFTITQLSHTFRPRRRPQELRNKRERETHD